MNYFWLDVIKDTLNVSLTSVGRYNDGLPDPVATHYLFIINTDNENKGDNIYDFYVSR